jgi:hypothetical protein
MPEEHFDLLQLLSRDPAQLRACPATVVRRNSGHAGLGCMWADKLPDHLFGEGSLVEFAAAV